MSHTDGRATGGPVEPAGAALPGYGVRSSATYLYVARMVVAIAGWAGTVAIVRTLSPSDWGRYSFVFGLLGIIGFVVDLKIGRIVLREVLQAGPHAGRVVGSYITLRLLVGLTSFAVAVVIVVAGGYESKIVWATVVAALGFFFIAPANGFVVWFQAKLWLRPYAVSMALGGLVQLALVFAIALSGRGTVVAFALAATGGQIAVLAWRIWALHRRHLGVRLRLDTSRWWVWLREAVPLALGAALVQIYYRVDIVMLQALDSARSVGEYTIGYKFADLATFFPEALLTPVTTLLVAAWPDDKASMRRHVRQAVVLLTVVGVAIGVGFALVAGPLIELLYGSQYRVSADAARLLVAGAVIQFFSYFAFITLVALGRNRPYALAGLVGLVVNIGLNLILIPRYSFNGSAVATVITEVVVVVLLIAAVRQTAGVLDVPWAAMARTVIAGLAMVAAFFGAINYLPWPVAGAIAAIVFLGSVHALRVDGRGGLVTLVRNARFDAGDQPNDL